MAFLLCHTDIITISLKVQIYRSSARPLWETWGQNVQHIFHGWMRFWFKTTQKTSFNLDLNSASDLKVSMLCWLQWASGFSDVYLCNFASLFLLYPYWSPGTHSRFHLTPTQVAQASWAWKLLLTTHLWKLCLWWPTGTCNMHADETSRARMFSHGRTSPDSSHFTTLVWKMENSVPEFLLNWEAYRPSSCFFLWQFKGLQNWKTEMKNWALNMLEWKTRNSFQIAFQNDAYECFLISSQTYLLFLALALNLGTDINLEERNRPIWTWFL